MSKITYTLEVITQKVGLREDEILRFIGNKIIHPFAQDELLFDDEDLARLRLISDLQEHCTPNEESLQVILHLIDQIHHLQKKIISRD